MPSAPESALAPASAAEGAQAAALVLHLVRDLPETVLWRPGVSSWGVCVLATCARAVVALDGCLQAARLLPGAPLPPRRYRLDTVARLLLGPLQILPLAGQTLFRCQLPPAADGRCCVMIHDNDLPWLAQRVSYVHDPVLRWPVAVDASASGD